MEFTGLHHITMITGDAQENARYYGDLLGLRLVKKTVNFDQPQAYHLYFGDETGAPGSILTWFEFPGAARGRAGAGAIHTLQLAVADEAALDFWEQRLDETTREPGVLRFADYDGLKLELVVSDLGNAPLRAQHPEIPEEHAISGLHGVRAYAVFSGVGDGILTDLLGFTYEGGGEYLLTAPSAGSASPTTPRPPGMTSRAPAASITSPGPRATRTTWPGRSGSPPPAAT